MNSIISISKKIFQFKTATDTEILHYIKYYKINCDIGLVKLVSSTVKKYRLFFKHYNKYGKLVTIKKFNSLPSTTSVQHIRSHYGLNPILVNRSSVYDFEYIMKRENLSKDDAILYITKYKADKATNLKNFIKKHGDIEGPKKYETWLNKSLKLGHSLSGIYKSLFSKHYYISKGFDERSSIELALKYQMENSPLHVGYYIARGKTKEFAESEIIKIHNKKIGIDSFRLKLEKEGCTSDEIYDIICSSRGHNTRENLGDEAFEERLSRTRKSFENKGIWIPISDISEYDLYRKDVWKYTNLNNLSQMANSSKIGLAGADGAYQLDHMYSIAQGFINNVPSNLIGSISNLKFIPWQENIKKQSNCTIKIEELHENY